MRRRERTARGAASTWLLILAGILMAGALGFCALMVAVPTARPAPPALAVPASPASSERKAEEQTLPDLRALLKDESARLRGRVGVHVRIEGHGQAGVDEDVPLPAASVIKLPLMAVVYDSWKKGYLKRLPVDEERVRRMITVSDNPSADTLLDRIGMSQVNTWLLKHRYSGTELHHKLIPPRGTPRPRGPNTVSAADMTAMLMAIARLELVDTRSSTEMRKLLLEQTRRGRIPAGLPRTVVCGNKTGTLNGIVNDVAFIEPPEGPRYTLAVLCAETGSDASVSAAIARLSRRIHDYVTKELAR